MAAALVLRLLPFALACVFTAALADSSGATACPQYSCGSVPIRYPFWVSDGMTSGSAGAGADAQCGYPNLHLECRRDTPVLTLPSGEYGVTSISYGGNDGDRAIKVFDIAATAGDCPRDLAGRNLTLPPGSPPPLSLTAKHSNLTFYLNCSFVGVSERFNVPCLQSARQNTYVFRDSDSIVPHGFDALCQEVVAFPVLDSEGDIIAALRSGFELTWAPAAGGDCADCEQRGGKCGYLWDANADFACFKGSSATPPAPSASGSPSIDKSAGHCTILTSFVGLISLFLVSWSAVA